MDSYKTYSLIVINYRHLHRVESITCDLHLGIAFSLQLSNFIVKSSAAVLVFSMLVYAT